MRLFGIIGKPLAQSFSATYFTQKFQAEGIDARYDKYEVEESEFDALLDRLDGINVTIPYKQRIIPHLERLDETAAEIGAVNVIHKHIGYNTDCLGFMDSIAPLLTPEDTHALVLGTGGAAKAVCYGLKKQGVQPLSVSRSPKEGQIGYDELTPEVIQRHTVIVNCTPVGMFPAIDACPQIPYSLLGPKHLLFDCIYNPEETLFLHKGRAQGCRTQNGHGMLIGQAQAAWKIWNEK